MHKNSPPFLPTLLLASTLLLPDSAPAERKFLTLTAEAANVIRTDITSATFGSGVEHQNVQFSEVYNGNVRGVMNPTPTAARNTIAQMKMGILRFPQGTTGLHYFWSDPTRSFISVSGPSANDLLTPTDIYNYTGPSNPNSLSMDRLFEVNTYKFIDQYGNQGYVNQYGSDDSRTAVINSTNLTRAADYAAAWVDNNYRLQSAGNRVNYWEVGNEDWVRWSPEQYATIFNAFASKMKGKNPGIRLLAQTLTRSWPKTGGGTNGTDWTARLGSGGISKNDVYALSEHQYLDGGQFGGTLEQQRTEQTRNMLATVSAGSRIQFLNEQITSLSANWKIWVTEFNIAQKDSSNNLMICQDLGHALVMADWTGKLLEQNVERIFPHSLDHHPAFSLVNYINGGTVDAPVITVPGYAFSIFPQEFGPTMVRTSIPSNPQLGSPSAGICPQVAAYASIRNSDKTLRLIVINRSMSDDVQLTIKTSGRTMAPAPAKFSYRQLYSPYISDSNRTVADKVKWSPAASYYSSSWALENIVIPIHSVNLFIIPLQ